MIDQAAETTMLEFCEQMRGTRHMQRRCEAGRGVDCIQFVMGALIAGGAVPEFSWPQYGQKIGLGANRNHMRDWFTRCLHCDEIDPTEWEPKTGDLGLFRVGAFANHIGIVVDGRFWHVTNRTPVHHQSIEIVRPRLEIVIRLTRAGIKKPPPHEIR